jgi:type I restriction enzyme M protein
MSPDNRRAIIDALTAFEPSDICKIFDRSHFYYNKQQLTLTEISDDGRSVKDTVCPEGKAFVVKNVSSIAFQGHTYNDLLQQPFSSLQGLAKAITADKGENLLTVTTDKGDSYELRPENNTIVYIQANGTEEDLGCGDIILKVTAKKGTDEVKNVKVQIEPRLTRDYEIVPFHFDEEENREEIDRFMQKYIFKPYVLDDDTIGVEINFNKEFYVPEPVEPVEDILKEIKELDEELGEIEL